MSVDVPPINEKRPLLRQLDRRGVKDKRVYFVIDDTQTLKRAKKMDAVGKLYHHATGTWGHGHTIVKACLHVASVTIPWASVVYVKKDEAPVLGMSYAKLTEIAATLVREATLPADRKVTVPDPPGLERPQAPRCTRRETDQDQAACAAADRPA